MITSEKEWRNAYLLLHALADFPETERVRAVRLDARRFSHRQRRERVIRYYEDGSCVTLERLPVPSEWEKGDVEGWFTENRYIRSANSAYDCTGEAFTCWFKVFRRRGCWFAYHSIGLDV